MVSVRVDVAASRNSKPKVSLDSHAGTYISDNNWLLIYDYDRSGSSYSYETMNGHKSS